MGTSKTLRLVGFFRELPHGRGDAPSLVDARRPGAAPEAARLVAYLRRGTPLVVSPGVAHDAFDGRTPCGTGSVLTDGEWAWPDDLAYYLERYNVVLPGEFVAWVVDGRGDGEHLSDAALRLLRLPSVEDPIVFDVWGSVVAGRRQEALDVLLRLRPSRSRVEALRDLVRHADTALVMCTEVTWSSACALRADPAAVFEHIAVYQAGYGPADRAWLHACATHELFYGGVRGCPVCTGFYRGAVGDG